MIIRTGCSGWSYESWIGPFYPPNTKSADFLKLYSRAFDTVEIDSTFYSQPNENALESWKNSTPEDFVFTAKVPRTITHDLKLMNPKPELDAFIQRIRVLGKKLGTVLIQLPPYLSYKEGHNRLEYLLSIIPENMNFAVEFRDNSWFREDVFDALRKRNVTLVWSEIPMIVNPDILTTKIIYVRLIGDRSISESEFGKVTRNKKESIDRWANAIREKGDAELVYLFSNNHFQGFAPATVNEFRRSFGLREIDWMALIRGGLDGHQRTLL